MIFGSVRILSVAFVCALMSGCSALGDDSGLTPSDLAYSHARDRGTTPAGPADDPRLFPDDNGSDGPSAVEGGTHLECVPYARAHSNINIHGDAYTWWDKAAGTYARGSDPLVGAVMVLNGYGKHRAHVAVVRRIISPREIRIDHANWLNDGAIYTNDPVIDVSDANDWSVVKVWNIRTGSWGTRTYHVQGFIGPGPAVANPVVASYQPHQPPSDDPIGRQIAASDSDADDDDGAVDGDDR